MVLISCQLHLRRLLLNTQGPGNGSRVITVSVSGELRLKKKGGRLAARGQLLQRRGGMTRAERTQKKESFKRNKIQTFRRNEPWV